MTTAREYWQQRLTQIAIEHTQWAQSHAVVRFGVTLGLAMAPAVDFVNAHAKTISHPEDRRPPTGLRRTTRVQLPAEPHTAIQEPSQ